MKKVSLLFFAFLFMGMLFSAQATAQGRIDLNGVKSAQQCENVSDNGFTATFSFGSIVAEEVSTEKGLFSNITMDGAYPSGNIGDPTLPAANKLIAVPFGANNVNVKVKNYSTTVYNLADYGIHSLYPQQTPLRKDQKPGDLPFEYNAKAYTTAGFVEHPIALFEIKGTMRGIQVGALTINPVQYDAVNNLIRVYNNIEVEVNFGEYDKTVAYNEFAKTFSPYFSGVYKAMFNEKQLRDVYDDHPDLWQNPVKMLVITNRAFESTIQEWVNWKTEKGFYVDVNYTDQIGTNSSAIRSFIQQKYNEDAPTFLMIMGDKNMVPESGTGSATSCVTDLNYSSVDGDEFSDMFHSRFPAENVAQMTSMLNKALEYEQLTMPDPSYLSNVLLIAGEDSGWGVTVGRPTIWYATNYYYNTEHGFNNVYEYSHGTYTGCYNNLNTGVGFVNYTAHGSNTSWAGPSFTVSDVNNLTNEHKYFLAMGNCCEAADWGISSTCFGEAMVRAENKAAYAYIGSCPSTYWLNDYYFGVGATSQANGQMPDISITTMGCYDAIWDNDAYNTVDAIRFIGNLASNAAQALGYTLHISTLYDWQAYHTLGDGSILPYRVAPTPNDVSHLPTLPIGVDSYEITAAPGSYAAITMDGVIYGAGMIDETGTTAIAINPITSGGDVHICVTHPQHVPYRTVIPAAALDGAYLAYDNYEVQHPVTNGSHVPMNVTIKNVGSETANNVTVTLSTESEYITFVNNEAVIETLPADDSYVIEDTFSFDVAVNVPNNEKIQFFVTCTDGEDTWESKFNVTALAPEFNVESIVNTELVPGENSVVTFEITNNGGADAYNAVFELFSSSQDVTVLDNSIVIDTFPAGRTKIFEVNIAVAEDVENGSTYELGYLLTSGHYSANGTYIVTVGYIAESFESGDFNMFPWTSGGTAAWTIVNTDAYDGTYCAKSGTISHSQSSDLILTVDVLADGEVSFYRKVSSESSYDKLFFYIDNIEKANWSGDQAWSLQTYPISVGTHTFKWSYQKDYSVSSGSDCAWIDNITFPPTHVTLALSPVTGLEATVQDFDVTLTWDEMPEAASFTVKRDGEEIAITSENTFTETLPEGIYNYCVIAKDDEGHASSPSFVTVDVVYDDVEEEIIDIIVYPNPVQSTLNLRVNADFQYDLFNNMGQKVLSGSASGQQQLNVNGFAKGIYVLRITTGTHTTIQKITVE
ncbi:MAG: T9SS type A sorting domain-containing protein [Bacteroidales bacterium]|nr:T9SS type A sorting domain-containing protein [Bacteroidales bacterium]